MLVLVDLEEAWGECARVPTMTSAPTKVKLIKGSHPLGSAAN